MIRYAIINTSTNIVENVILWDGVSDWTPPDDHIAVNAEDTIVGPKWTHNSDGTFSAPAPVVDPEPPAAPTLAELQAQLTALQTQISLLHT